MKKFSATITLLALAFQSVPAMAWVGGPYSNNTPDGKSGGVFQGSVTFKNGSGTFKFATGAEPFITPQASSVMMHEGVVYYGDAFGMVDFQSESITCTTNGLSSLGTVTPLDQTTTDPSVVNGTTPVGDPGTTFGNGFDNGVCNTQFAGKIKGPSPGTTFKGKGWAYVFAADDYDVTFTTATTGPESTYLPIFEIDDNGNAAVTDYVVVPPTNATQTQNFQAEYEPSEKRKFRTRVYGSRVSTIAYTTFGQASTTP